MKLLLSIAIAIVFFSCVNHPEKKVQELPPKTNLLDSIKVQSQMAFIEFHHQIQKMSLVAKQYHDRQQIDSLFTYIGQLNDDTLCLKGGLFNYFGQINFCKDSSLSDPIAELHFVLEGNCEGFYLQTENYLRRYELNAAGKKFLLELYEPYKKQLNGGSRQQKYSQKLGRRKPYFSSFSTSGKVFGQDKQFSANCNHQLLFLSSSSGGRAARKSSKRIYSFPTKH